MDICDKLLETVDANDPQFKVLLNNAIQAEIISLEEELAAKRALNERKLVELRAILERRKNLKKNIQEKSELLSTMEQASKCLQDYSISLLETLTYTKNMLDEDSLRQLSIINEEKKLLDQLEKKCIEYEAEFEKDPLAQERKACKQELLKVEINLEISKMNIKDIDRNYEIYTNIQKMRDQQTIIAFAKLWLNHRKNVEESKILKQEAAELKLKLAEQDEEIQTLIKEKADKDKQNVMARFQMPPPIMDKRFVDTIFSQPYLLTTKTNTPANIDSLNDNASISSSIFEEMCSISEKMNIPRTEAQQLEIEPDVISLSSTQDSNCTRDNGSERSFQCLESRVSRKRSKSSVKEKNEKLVPKKIETSKRSAISPRVNPVSKKNKHDILIPNNDANEKKIQEQSSVKLGAIKKVNKNLQKQERNSNLADTDIPERLEIPEDSVTIDTDLHSENRSLSGSVGSFSFTGSNIRRKDSDADLNSDLSLQSHQEDQNNSPVFTEDELSNAENYAPLSESNALPPEPPVSMPSGIFGSQNKRFLNFQGLIFK